jgi:hypothetical protein
LISQKQHAKNINGMQAAEKPNGVVNGALNQLANQKK